MARRALPPPPPAAAKKIKTTIAAWYADGTSSKRLTEEEVIGEAQRRIHHQLVAEDTKKFYVPATLASCKLEQWQRYGPCADLLDRDGADAFDTDALQTFMSDVLLPRKEKERQLRKKERQKAAAANAKAAEGRRSAAENLAEIQMQHYLALGGLRPPLAAHLKLLSGVPTWQTLSRPEQTAWLKLNSKLRHESDEAGKLISELDDKLSETVCAKPIEPIGPILHRSD